MQGISDLEGPFSKRHGHTSGDVPIVVRDDAPACLREAVPLSAKNCGMSYGTIRELVCQELLRRPDPNNWSEIPNVRDEIFSLLEECPWFKIYDIVESLCKKLPHHVKDRFALDLNDVFRQNGIGYELRNGLVIYRGSQSFGRSTMRAAELLDDSNRPRAATEMKEALNALSRRPNPNAVGAVRHAMAALEATARDLAGKPNPTLGRLVSQLDLPPPLDQAIEKLWGFSSDRARHVREGQQIGVPEAELIVSVAAAMISFLVEGRESHLGLPGEPPF